jgi:hypothetical protein
VTARSLAEQADSFAQELQGLLDGVLPGQRVIRSVQAADGRRYVVRPEGDDVQARRLPLTIDGEQLASLQLDIYLSLDRVGRYLKATRSDVVVHSVLDRQPLVRLEYRADMQDAPVAHWQFHAERGAFTHLLSHASRTRPRQVRRPHDLSALHLPVGGERYRPCLEDVLQFLVEDCGVDAVPGWRTAVTAGRERWRRRQLASAVRDAPGVAVRILGELGYRVEPPTHVPSDNLAALQRA